MTKKDAPPAADTTESAKEPLKESYPVNLTLSSQYLRDLRTKYGISPNEIVQELKIYYPGFDRTMLSKAENGNKYGVSIPREIIAELYERFAPGKFPARYQHRLKNRVYVRLTDIDYAALVSLKEENGYETMQDFLTDIIRKVTKEGI